MIFSHRSSTRETCPPDANPLRFSFIVLVLATLLLAQGCIIGWVGWHAVETGHFELGWKSGGTFGGSNGVLVCQGADAVSMGVGLGSFGIMLSTWSCGLVTGFFASRSNGFLRKFNLLLGWVSFAMLSLGCVCVYPPWRLASLSFHAVILITLETCPRATKTGFPGLAKVVFPGLIASSIILVNFAPPFIAVGVLPGILASFGLLIHLFTLFPKLGIENG